MEFVIQNHVYDVGNVWNKFGNMSELFWSRKHVWKRWNSNGTVEKLQKKTGKNSQVWAPRRRKR